MADMKQVREKLEKRCRNYKRFGLLNTPLFDHEKYNFSESMIEEMEALLPEGIDLSKSKMKLLSVESDDKYPRSESFFICRGKAFCENGSERKADFQIKNGDDIVFMAHVYKSGWLTVGSRLRGVTAAVHSHDENGEDIYGLLDNKGLSVVGKDKLAPFFAGDKKAFKQILFEVADKWQWEEKRQEQQSRINRMCHLGM